MNVKYSKIFLKDIQNIDSKIAMRCKKLIEELKNLDSQRDIKNLRKLTWYKCYYRIRIWDYRVWCKIEDTTIELIRFQNRGNIYKVFP